jgi:hypothetical protein
MRLIVSRMLVFLALLCFALLIYTTVYPFYNVTEEAVPKKVKHHFTPFIDPRYKERSLAEAKLTEIIPLCWAYDPSQRIDIFELTGRLRNALKELVP